MPDPKYAPVFTGLADQNQPATAEQQVHIENFERAMVGLRKVADNGDLTPQAKEAVDDLVSALDGLTETAVPALPDHVVAAQNAEQATADNATVRSGELTEPARTAVDSDAKTATDSSSSAKSAASKTASAKNTGSSKNAKS